MQGVNKPANRSEFLPENFVVVGPCRNNELTNSTTVETALKACKHSTQTLVCPLVTSGGYSNREGVFLSVFGVALKNTM